MKAAVFDAPGEPADVLRCGDRPEPDGPGVRVRMPARGLRTVNVVRRAEQGEELRGLGADAVVAFDAPICKNQTPGPPRDLVLVFLDFGASAKRLHSAS